MKKEEFFIKDNEIKDLNIFDEVFKYKLVTGGDELDWVEDYTDILEIPDPKDPKKIKFVRKDNLGKLGQCKLRNIVEVPFTKEELKVITGFDKQYSEYSNDDKDVLFRKLNPKVLSALISAIDKKKSNKAKN